MNNDAVLDESSQEYVMPCAEAVLMATLALMTGYAQNQSGPQAPWLARKIRSNLDILAGHPNLSGGFKSALTRLMSPWDQQCRLLDEMANATSVVVCEPSRWLPAARSIQ